MKALYGRSRRRKKSWQAVSQTGNGNRNGFFSRRPAGAYEKEGSLKLHPSTVTFEAAKSPVFAVVRQCDFGCETEAVFDFKPAGGRQRSRPGAVVLASDFPLPFVGKRTQRQQNFLVVEKTAEDFRQTAFCAPAPVGNCGYVSVRIRNFLLLLCHPAKGRFTRYAKLPPCLSCELAGKCLAGTVIGLYAMSEVRQTRDGSKGIQK